MKQLLILSILALICNQVLATKIQVSGFVRDGLTNETLIGAHVQDANDGSGRSTDNNGYFSFSIQTPAILLVSYIGYETKRIEIAAERDTLLLIGLNTNIELKEVSVKGTRRTEHFVTRLSAKEIDRIPSLTGKPDVMKVLQLQPGVQTQSEGLSLMMVRGGEPGQNLYLLDNVPLTYVNHLGGFMSVFNPDMINAIDFYKGNFPAQFSGKLSSIVNVTQREGNLSKHQGAYSLGVTDASCLFEGPLFDQKMSYIVTARKTLTDIPLATLTAMSDLYTAIYSYGFHDFNLKLNWKYDASNTFKLNIYQGDDYLNYWYKPWATGNSSDERMHAVQRWGNWLVSTRWDKVMGPKLYAENIASFSWYRNLSAQWYKSQSDSVEVKATNKNRSSVGDFSLRSFWKYAAHQNWNIEFGGQLSYLLYDPNYVYNSSIQSQTAHTRFHSFESSAYLNNHIRLFSFMQLQPSVRMSSYASNQHSFLTLEPRLNTQFDLTHKHRVSFDYMRVTQNSHMVFAQSEIIKKEIWLPATEMLPPQMSDQVSLNFEASDLLETFDVVSSIYFKRMKNLTTLKEGYENMIGITGIDNKLEKNGIGESKGLELTFRKTKGTWQGEVSYAYSHSEREFENINQGRPYEYDYNRKHSVSLNCNRAINENWHFSATWIIQSGLPYTPALAKQYIWDSNREAYDKVGLIFGDKNSKHMQPYHRLDLGFSKTTQTKRGYKAVWNFAVYNAYNRINPYLYYYDNDNNRNNTTKDDAPLQQYKLGLFSIIPSVSYKVFFDYTKPKPIKKAKVKKNHNWLYFSE